MVLATGDRDSSSRIRLLMMKSGTHKNEQTENGKQQHFQESDQPVYQRKIESTVTQRHHNNKTDHLKQQPAEQFTQDQITPGDRCRKNSFKHQTLPEIKEQKSRTEYSRHQQGESQLARQNKIDLLVHPSRNLIHGYRYRTPDFSEIIFRPACEVASSITDCSIANLSAAALAVVN